MRTFIRKEPVLVVAVVLALASAFFVPPSKEYLSYIDVKTLACLFCLMAAVKGLECEGVLEKASGFFAKRLKNARMLAVFLVFACFFVAMLMTNDVALIALVPVSLSMLAACGLAEHGLLLVVFETIAANIGSSLTPIGNPQNLYLFHHYGMNLSEFLAAMLPIVLCGGVLLALCCLLFPKTPLKVPATQHDAPVRGRVVGMYGILFLLSVATVFGLLHYGIAAAVVALAILLTDTHTLKKVDYFLMLTFAVIFIFVGNISHIAPIHAFLSWVTEKNTLLTAILASQFTSNVPAAILLSGFTDNARGLLLGVNIGGMGTLIASMASVISYKQYTSAHPGQALAYLKKFTKWNAIFLAVLTALGVLLS